MSAYHATHQLRKALHISQETLAELTGTCRSMIARHESGEKELNLEATCKLTLLSLCVNGAFEDRGDLHHAHPARQAENTKQLNRQHLRLQRTLTANRLSTAVLRLQRMDDDRAALEVTIRRLEQTDLTRLVGFGATDEAWKTEVVTHLRRKLADCSGEARFKLECERAALEATLAVIDDALAEAAVEELMAEVQNECEEVVGIIDMGEWLGEALYAVRHECRGRGRAVSRRCGSEPVSSPSGRAVSRQCGSEPASARGFHAAFNRHDKSGRRARDHEVRQFDRGYELRRGNSFWRSRESVTGF